jgi:transcriptional regulator with XRE-family HTH domain
LETIYATMEGNMETRNNIVNTLASNLRFLRHNTQIEEPITGKVKYMSQRHLAEFIGSATQQVSKFELGTNIMSSYQIFKVSKVFDISIDKLFDAELVKSVYKKTIKQNIYAE